jgi:hypothetical protein
VLFDQNRVTGLIIYKVINLSGFNMGGERNLVRLIAGWARMRRNHCVKTMRTCRDESAWLYVRKQRCALSRNRDPIDIDNRKI